MTDSLFKISPLLPVWAIAIFGLVGLTTFMFLESKKKTRYRNLRWLCAGVLVLSICALLLQLSIRKQKTDFTILLTEHANQKIVDSLQKEYSGANLLQLGNTQPHAAAKKIATVHDLPQKNVRLVVGDGLSPAGLDVIGNAGFTFLKNEPPKGIVSLNLPGSVKAFTKSKLTGVYNNSGDSVRIFFEGPGGKEDSVTITQKGLQRFDLDFLPKEKGIFSYSLSVDGQKEFVPVKVEPERQLNIMIIQMFPTFETGYLKNLLAKDHKLVFRYQLSKNNFRYEYINHQPVRANRISRETLNEFDLVILDSDALMSFSPAERKNIVSSVGDGLGILLLFNEQPKTNRSIQSLLPTQFRPFNNDTATFFLEKKLTLPTWPIEAINDGQVIPTIKNNNRILAGYMYEGFGKIGFQLFQETYKLTLEGDSASYKNLWSTILQKSARTVTNNFQIAIKNDFPVFANEPITVEVIGSADKAPTLLHDGIEIPMAEDFVIDDLWRTKVWPNNSGWHELQIKGDSTKQHYLVSKNGDWKSLATANSIRNTLAIASTQPVRATPTWSYEPFAPWLFYFMFLITAGFLWLVPKI